MRATSAVIGVAFSVSLGVSGCAATVPVRTVATRPPAAVMAQLWIDPGPSPRDLYWGVGGRRQAPPPRAEYRFESKDETGFSVSYDVIDPGGLEWSAKIGAEAQTEVVVSRILWGIGYHQPPVYYLPAWRLSGGHGEQARQGEARFRPKLEDLPRDKEYWSWANNPFSGTRELKGLLVVLLMLNSTDLKDDNNSIYRPARRWEGAMRWFVVRDLGASLGETGKLFPRRNCVDGFERRGFITRIEGDRVAFDYDGRHQRLLEMITPADVLWAAQRMARLSARQWRDAFRSANYHDDVAERYIARIRQKIDDGLALRARPAGDRRS